MRYTAVFAFFLESYDDAVERLKTFVEKAARATLIGDVFDDAATGQGLAELFPACFEQRCHNGRRGACHRVDPG